MQLNEEEQAKALEEIKKRWPMGPYWGSVPTGSPCPNCGLALWQVPFVNGVPPWMTELYERVRREIEATPPRYYCANCKKQMDPHPKEPVTIKKKRRQERMQDADGS